MAELKPRDCEVRDCDCTDYRWNGSPWALVTDPPSTCVCGHQTFRHRFRRDDAGGVHDYETAGA